MRLRLALLTCLILCASTAPALASLGPIDDYRYDRAKDCRKRPTPGGLAREEREGQLLGQHALRALGQEQRLAARGGPGRRLAWNCRSWWSGSEGMDKYSVCYTAGGKRRKHVNRTEAHMDHIHIGLNWAGAPKKTTFWAR